MFDIAGEWIRTHQTLSVAIGGALCILIGMIKPERVKALGRACSDLLKRIPIVGPALEKKVEVIVDNFEDGMKEDSQKQDEANLFSPDMPTVSLERKEELKSDIEKTYPNNIGGDK